MGFRTYFYRFYQKSECYTSFRTTYVDSFNTSSIVLSRDVSHGPNCASCLPQKFAKTLSSIRNSFALSRPPSMRICTTECSSNFIWIFFHVFRELQAIENGETDPVIGPNSLDKERSLLNDDPKWLDTTYVLANYKTEPCKKPPRLCRQGYACPQYHNNKDKRRSPKKYKYRYAYA